MSLNAATIEFLVAKGLSAADILEVAWELEGGNPCRKLPQPANDRNRRLRSSERSRAYAELCRRDGEHCQQCSAAAHTIWRKNGRTVGDDGAHFTIVYPTRSLEVDHKTPLWAGGGNDIANLWLLCVDCHKTKTAREASQRRRG